MANSPDFVITYDQSATLMRDTTFTGRVKVALVKFASFTIGEASNTTLHALHHHWASRALMDADAQVAKIMPVVVLDPGVQNQGSAIDDATLQSAVEAAISKISV